ncbi:MAG TPA: hypothetical protein VF911_11630, partial [Thermoanaerobaculia bacterium]
VGLLNRDDTFARKGSIFNAFRPLSASDAACSCMSRNKKRSRRRDGGFATRAHFTRGGRPTLRGLVRTGKLSPRCFSNSLMQVVKDRSMSATNVNPSVAETAFRARSMSDSGSFTVTRKR